MQYPKWHLWELKTYKHSQFHTGRSEKKNKASPLYKSFHMVLQGKYSISFLFWSQLFCPQWECRCNLRARTWVHHVVSLCLNLKVSFLCETLPTLITCVWPLMCFQRSWMIKSLVVVWLLGSFFSSVNFLVWFQCSICNKGLSAIKAHVVLHTTVSLLMYF